jgi:hypothetical protein
MNDHLIKKRNLGVFFPPNIETKIAVNSNLLLIILVNIERSQLREILARISVGLLLIYCDPFKISISRNSAKVT